MQLRWWWIMAYWRADCSGVGRAERTMKVALVPRGATFALPQPSSQRSTEPLCLYIVSKPDASGINRSSERANGAFLLYTEYYITYSYTTEIANGAQALFD